MYISLSIIDHNLSIFELCFETQISSFGKRVIESWKTNKFDWFSKWLFLALNIQNIPFSTACFSNIVNLSRVVGLVYQYESGLVHQDAMYFLQYTKLYTLTRLHHTMKLLKNIVKLIISTINNAEKINTEKLTNAVNRGFILSCNFYRILCIFLLTV